MSASFHWMPWNSAMALPNWRRSLTYLSAASSAPRPMPSESAAMEMRPPSSMRMASTKPSPSLPRRFSSGISQSLEDELGGIAGAQAELVFFLSCAKALGAFFDGEGREAVCALRLIGNGNDHGDVGVVAICDECLGSVQNVAVAFFCRGGAGVAGVGAGAGGLVSAHAASHSPLASSGMYLRFCASLPARKM